MARTHGRIYSRIWDGDFRDLSSSAQARYQFLLSQPDLNQAGLIGLRLRRWAGMARDLTADQVIADLEELEAARYILVDHDEEEVLIRTFIRNDGVYKQPNVMLAAGNDAREIASSKLRAALLVELDRLPLDELSYEVKGKAERSPRAIVEGVIETLRKAFAESPERPTPTPTEPFEKGSGNPSGNPSARDTGRLNARVSPTPTPTPSSAPTERAAESPPETAPLRPAESGGSSDPRPDGDVLPGFDAPPSPTKTRGQIVYRLAHVYSDAIPMCNYRAVEGVVRNALNGRDGGKHQHSDGDISDALLRLAKAKANLTAANLMRELEGPPQWGRENRRRPADGNQTHWDDPNASFGLPA